MFSAQSLLRWGDGRRELGGSVRPHGCIYLGEDRPPLTDGEEGGVGEASLAAGDVDGGVDESALEPEGAASSESPWEGVGGQC